MELFNGLTKDETESLLKAPVLISVFVASRDHEISKKEKAEAVKLTHLKTFTADPHLQSYYKEVEKNFSALFEDAVRKYDPFDDAKRDALMGEINTVNTIIAKLGKEYATIFQRSFSNYVEHVKKADRVILENFVFPFPLPGLTD